MILDSKLGFEEHIKYILSKENKAIGQIRKFANFAKFKGKHLCQSPFFIKKETLRQVFSFEFGEISENTFFDRTTLVTASA